MDATNKRKRYKWIKTSDKLPLLNEWVLIWKDTLDYIPEIAQYTGEVERSYYKDGKEYKEIRPRWYYQNMSAVGTFHPLAWMSLPTPPYDFIDEAKNKRNRK